jgi:hypothetical protein
LPQASSSRSLSLAMSSSFKIREHIIDTQHVREYSRATAHSQEDVLKLVVKQYTPLDNPSPKPGDLTIIGAHANGFPKVCYLHILRHQLLKVAIQELYEPLWEDLLAESVKHGFRIRSIWIADVAWQGGSGHVNQHLLGNDRTNNARTFISASLIGL